MADGRHIENRICAIIRLQIVRYSPNFAVDVEIRALRGVYTDTYDNDALLHCFMLLFMSDCTNFIIMHVRLLRVLNNRLQKIKYYR